MGARMSPSGAWAASHAAAAGAEPRAVALSDLLIARPTGLTHPETWAILFHAVQALQDLLLSDGANEQFWLPMIHPGTIFLTCKGRVTLSLSQVVLIAPDLRGYTAPEYRPGKPKTDTEFEKMLVYSLGATLQGALGSERAGLTASLGADPACRPSELSRVLAAMGKQLVNERASLMHLLDVISEYSVRREQTKPFSHTIMDLYRETIIYKNALPDLQDAALKTYLRNFTVEPYSDRNILPKIESSPMTISQKWNLNSEPSVPDKSSFTDVANLPSTKIIGATSTKTKCTNEEPNASQAKKKLQNRRQPVKRAASRLYRAFNADKRSNKDQADCVGPEFVIRASLPSKQLYLGDVKCENLKKLIIIMLNGVKLEISCRPESTTAGELFSEIVRSENIEENFFLGLAILIAGDFVFVPSDVKLSKIIALEQGIDTLFVRVRFFLSSLRGIRNHQSRHLLYLQIRRSLLENQLPCTVEQLCELGGLALQIEFGDYTEKHKTNHYFLLEHYLPEVTLGNFNDAEKLRDSLTQAHVIRSGLSKEKATESFISMAQALTFYGFHVYSATWIAKNKQRDIWLCISANGINLYAKSSSGLLDNSPEVQEVFKWQSIRTLCYSKHFLCIFPMHTTERKALPRKYKLKMDHKKSYYAFRLASLHHEFFHRLRNEYSSLQPISQQFGVLLKDLKNETNSLYKLGKLEKSFNSHNCDNDAEHKTEFKILLGNKYKESLKKNKCKRSKSVNELSSEKNVALEEYQNKENEFDLKENMCDAKNNFISLPQTVGVWDKRKGVLMGTRAFSSGGQRVSRSLEAVNAYNVELSDKLSNTSSTNILMTDAYVLNSSIKSCEDEFLPDFQETLSESLLNKLKNISFVDERILKSVTIFRDIHGSLGLQVMEGSDNKAYVQSVVAHGPAALSGNIFKGDQIVAVNGQNLLKFKYSDALEILKNTGHKVELVLSQLSGSTFVQSTLERKPSVSGGGIQDMNAANNAYCDACRSLGKYKGFQSVDRKCSVCTCNLEHHPTKDQRIHYSNMPDLHRTGNALDQGLNRVLCNTLTESKPPSSPQDCGKPLNCTCTNLRYKDCDIAKKEFDEIALPRSIRLGRRWRGPVRYPVTPIKKPVSQSDSDSSYFLNTSDEEQIFI